MGLSQPTAVSNASFIAVSPSSTFPSGVFHTIVSCGGNKVTSTCTCWCICMIKVPILFLENSVRLCAIFVAKPKDENQRPKTLPDFESAVLGCSVGVC